MTIKDLTDEVNRWLRVKWQHANYNRELPTISSTANYMDGLIKKEIANNDYVICKTDNVRRQEDSLESTCASATVRMRLRLDARWDDDGPQSLCLVSMVERDESTLLFFPLTVKRCEDGEDVCDGVQEIACSHDETTTLLDVFHSAAKFQHSLFPGINERWAAATKKFREENPICPVCGGDVDISSYDESNNGLRRVHCECCGWVPRGKAYYKSDCAEGDFFEKELRYLKKIQDFTAAKTQAETGMDQSVQAFAKLVGRCPEEPECREMLRKSISIAVKKLDNLLKGALGS